MTNGEYIGSGAGVTKLLLHLNNNSTDSSGNNNNGTDSNITYIDGKFGKCASLDNVTLQSHITFPVINIGDGTFIYWLKTTHTSGAIYSSGSLSNNSLFAITIGTTGTGSGTSGKISVGRYNGSWNNITTNSVCNSGNYECWIVTCSGTAIKIYRNGALDGSGTSHSAGTLLTSTKLGQLSWDPTNTITNGFRGQIDEKIVNGVVFTPQQVAKYYSYAKGRYATL